MFSQHCPAYPCNCVRCSSPDGLEPGVHYAQRGAVKSVARKGWLSAIVLAAVTLAGTAGAEVCDGRGKCVQWTADKVATEQRLRCVYGGWRQSTDSKGRTVLTRDKVCMAPAEFTR
jgi:hypothetical protein